MHKDDAKLQSPERRRLIKVSGLALGGLMIATWLPPAIRKSAATEILEEEPGDDVPPPPTALGAFVRIDRAGNVTLITPKIEMGQGVQSSLAAMLAEELEVGLDRVTLQEAPPNEELYVDPILHFQATGGSTSTRSFWEPLRTAGAAGRLMLIQAAASQWNVAADTCQARNGIVYGPDDQQLGYGELVEAAAELPVPEQIPLKTPDQFRLIGKPLPRLDTPAKVDGSARFTIDLQLPNMKIATSLTCPVQGGRLASLDDRAALQVRGVRQVVRLDDAVAVIGDHMWAAIQGIRALDVEWDLGDNARLDSARIEQALRDAASRDGALATNTGDIDTALENAASRIEAEYEMPFLAHSALEPMSCVAEVRGDTCELWVGTQVPVMAQAAAAEAAGVAQENVIVNNQLIGGAFGRRLESDFVAQAAAIARQVDYPVKLVWTREEDTTHDLYRPHYLDRFTAAVDEQGMPTGWRHTIIGGSVMARFSPQALGENGLDPDAIEISAEPLYRLPNLHVRYVPENPRAVRVSWWRGVGQLHGVYVVESFIDELAHAAGQDPVDYRMALLEAHPRAQAVLRRATQEAGWGQPLPEGRGRGVAVHGVFGSYVATVVELTTDAQGGLRIERLVCAVDCGLATNPTSVKSQIEGGTLFGLSAALFNEVTVKEGRVEQSNFHDYRQIRMSDAPPVEVHLIASQASPGGIGEAGTALIAPALVNALHAAAGRRIRRLPLSRAGYHVVAREA
ncbi:xanthine dehydrogenase family protein molybdopterin-binding subunit [Halomonas shantousis]